MKKYFAYPANVEPDDAGFYLVTFPDFPEAAADGRSREEALADAEDALEEAIAGRMNRQECIPDPSSVGVGQVLILIPANMAVKAALYAAVKEQGVGRIELAERLGADETAVRRLLDPHHRSKLNQMEAALAVLGRKLVIGVESRL